jgi:hypothetical protein
VSKLTQRRPFWLCVASLKHFAARRASSYDNVSSG